MLSKIFPTGFERCRSKAGKQPAAERPIWQIAVGCWRKSSINPAVFLNALLFTNRGWLGTRGKKRTGCRVIIITWHGSKTEPATQWRQTQKIEIAHKLLTAGTSTAALSLRTVVRLHSKSFSFFDRHGHPKANASHLNKYSVNAFMPVAINLINLDLACN